ncbi:hypothetical protein KNP414_00234 [Paenibacillus mucilaginosus KNP414]|uniref:Uncharacterized protein n=1 Tax=Paenibacillus mucilaginosus (strain KNP414) TaxID=1036673 RepID=F8FM67_PAEMK|nr:hypothetical protein KNP414_00234 [Paenibacillus mucilaginosus KNP414]
MDKCGSHITINPSDTNDTCGISIAGNAFKTCGNLHRFQECVKINKMR